MASRTAALFCTAALIASCGSSGGSAAKDLPTTQATDAVASASNTTDAPAETTTSQTTSDPDESEGTDLRAESSVMVDLLASVPLAAYEAARQDGATTVEIEMVDLIAASDLAGLDRPDPGDVGRSLDWLRTLTVGAPVTDGGTGFAFFPGRFPDPNAAALPDEVAAELGFSIFDINRSVSFTALPVTFHAVSGTGLVLAPGLADLGGGVVSAGAGDDFDVDVEGRTAARPLGRPLRLATNDGVVAASLSTPLIESWLAGEPSLIDVAQLAAAAEALDAAGSVSGYLIESDFVPFAPAELGADQLDVTEYSEPFRVLGIGTTAVNGRAANAIAYVFDDDAAAGSALPELDAAWRAAPLVAAQGQSVADFFTVVSVEQQGRVVLVVAAVADQSTTFRALEMAIRAEPLLMNN